MLNKLFLIISHIMGYFNLRKGSADTNNPGAHMARGDEPLTRARHGKGAVAFHVSAWIETIKKRESYEYV